MLKNCVVLGMILYIGVIYYILLLKNNELKKVAFFFKIFLLSVSFILAFIEKEFILICGITFGGKISVMLLALIEIVETFVDMKKNNDYEKKNVLQK